MAVGELGDSGFHGGRRGVAAGRGTQTLGQLAAHRVGVGADDADSRGGEELHHQLSDQPEADDQGHFTEL